MNEIAAAGYEKIGKSYDKVRPIYPHMAVKKVLESRWSSVHAIYTAYLIAIRLINIMFRSAVSCVHPYGYDKNN